MRACRDQRRTLTLRSLALLCGALSFAALVHAEDPKALRESVAWPALLAKAQVALERVPKERKGIHDQLARIRAEDVKLEQSERSSREALEGRARTLYRLTRPYSLPLHRGLEGLYDHLSRTAKLQRLLELQADAREQSRARRAELRAAEAQQRTQLAALDKRELELTSEISRLEATYARTSIRARAPVATRSSNDIGHGLEGGTFRVHDDASDAALENPAVGTDSFRARRGMLPSPIRDIFQTQSGSGRGPVGSLIFMAQPGATVRSIASGTVAFAGPNPQHGMLVIVQHTAKFRSFYGGLASITVRTGDDISEQAKLGSVGEGTTNPGLYFELRRAEHTVDARQWLGL